jgi:formamidopyrimidine-DNA glycosylase
MPELPEVETVRRSLQDHLPGRTVQRVEVRDQLVLRGQPVCELLKGLEGQTFASLERHGKLLFFPLKGGSLIVHLGMTGQLTVRLPDRSDTEFVRHQKTGLQRTLQHPPDKHTHISLHLDGELSLHYRDIRKFGRVFMVPQTQREGIVTRFGLGVDPLSEAYSRAYVANSLKTRKTPIKSALLDQRFLAGLGNIYVDEALFLAGIRPGRAAYRVKGRSLDRLTEAIPQVLLKGVEAGGTTLRDFISGTGQAGYNQEGLVAYGRYGQPCIGCGAPLRRGSFAGRTTTWCANCQS